MYRHRVRTRLEQVAEIYPALYPFGTNLDRFLDAESEKTASFEERLRSIWRYLIGKIDRFVATFTRRELAILDVEDCVHSVVEKLIENDHLWDPSRGRYSTFVDAVATSFLVTCHERSKTVMGPSNSHARLKAYRERSVDGTLTPAMRETMSRIEKAIGDYDSLDEASFTTNGHPEFDVAILRNAIRSFDDPLEVWVLVRRYGLFDVKKMTFREIAWKLNVSEKIAKKIGKSAKENLKNKISVVEDFYEAI